MARDPDKLREPKTKFQWLMRRLAEMLGEKT